MFEFSLGVRKHGRLRRVAVCFLKWELQNVKISGSHYWLARWNVELWSCSFWVVILRMDYKTGTLLFWQPLMEECAYLFRLLNPPSLSPMAYCMPKIYFVLCNRQVSNRIYFRLLKQIKGITCPQRFVKCGRIKKHQSEIAPLWATVLTLRPQPPSVWNHVGCPCFNSWCSHRSKPLLL